MAAKSWFDNWSKTRVNEDVHCYDTKSIEFESELLVQSIMESGANAKRCFWFDHIINYTVQSNNDGKSSIHISIESNRNKNPLVSSSAKVYDDKSHRFRFILVDTQHKKRSIVSSTSDIIFTDLELSKGAKSLWVEGVWDNGVYENSRGFVGLDRKVTVRCCVEVNDGSPAFDSAPSYLSCEESLRQHIIRQELRKKVPNYLFLEASTLKSRGNVCFKALRYEEAINAYCQGVEVLAQDTVKHAESSVQNILLAELWSNISVSYYSSGYFKLAMEAAESCQRTHKTWLRAYHRLAKAYLAMGRSVDARQSVKNGELCLRLTHIYPEETITAFRKLFAQLKCECNHLLEVDMFRWASLSPPPPPVRALSLEEVMAQSKPAEAVNEIDVDITEALQIDVLLPDTKESVAVDAACDVPVATEKQRKKHRGGKLRRGGRRKSGDKSVCTAVTTVESVAHSDLCEKATVDIDESSPSPVENNNSARSMTSTSPTNVRSQLLKSLLSLDGDESDAYTTCSDPEFVAKSTHKTTSVKTTLKTNANRLEQDSTAPPTVNSTKTQQTKVENTDDAIKWTERRAHYSRYLDFLLYYNQANHPQLCLQPLLKYKSAFEQLDCCVIQQHQLQETDI